MKNGFTLVEMLVTVTIILIMSMIALNGYNNQMIRTRDETRKTHLEKIRAGLELYRTVNLSIGYPDSLDELVPDYLEGTVPEDPKGYSYYYSKTSTKTYELCTYLESGGSDDCGSNCGAPGNCNYRRVNP